MAYCEATSTNEISNWVLSLLQNSIQRTQKFNLIAFLSSKEATLQVLCICKSVHKTLAVELNGQLIVFYWHFNITVTKYP